MPPQALTLSGQAVTLTPLESNDIPLLTKVALAHPEAFTLTSTPTSAAESKAYFSKALADMAAAKAHVFAMRSADTLIGTTRYTDIDWHQRSCELGYTWFDPAHFGTAVNVESKFLLLRHLFEELGFLRAQINTDSRNERSQAAVQALGAQYEGTLRSHKFDKHGYRRDTLVFSVIAEDWPKVKEILSARLEEKRQGMKEK